MTQDKAQRKIEDMMNAIGPIEVLRRLESLCPSDATAGSPRVVWVGISNINGCALLVEDAEPGDGPWPGVTWTRFVEENDQHQATASK